MRHFKPELPKSHRVAQNLFLPTNHGRESINPADIIYLEAQINYTIFHTSKSKYVASFSLKFFEEVLKANPDFLRINRSYILNLKYMAGLKWGNQNKEVKLHNGIMLTISRRKAKEIKEIIMSKVAQD